MSEKTYRIIQWMTGDVGQVGVRHFADNPVFDLVGVLVHTPEKVGKDAGEIAGIAPIGVVAIDDVELMMAMDADCVFYTPVIMDTDTATGSCGPARTSSRRAGSSIRRRTSARAVSRSARPARRAGPELRRRHPPRLCRRHLAAHTCARGQQDREDLRRRDRERPYRRTARPYRLDGFRQGQRQIPH